MVAKKEYRRYRVLPGLLNGWVFSVDKGRGSTMTTISFLQLNAELPARAITGRCEASCYFRCRGNVLISLVTDKFKFLFKNFLAF